MKYWMKKMLNDIKNGSNEQNCEICKEIKTFQQQNHKSIKSYIVNEQTPLLNDQQSFGQSFHLQSINQQVTPAQSNEFSKKTYNYYSIS